MIGECVLALFLYTKVHVYSTFYVFFKIVFMRFFVLKQLFSEVDINVLYL